MVADQLPATGASAARHRCHGTARGIRGHRPGGWRRRTQVRPRDVAALALDGVEAGAYEVLADDISRQVKAGLAGDLAGLYAQLAK